MRKLVRFLLVVAAVAGVVWALRDKLLPPARPPVEPPPPFRRATPATPAAGALQPSPAAPAQQPVDADPPPTAAVESSGDTGAEPEPATDENTMPGHESSPALDRPAANDAASSDDLTAIKGIGPVFAERLHKEGITSFGDLVGADAAAVATHIDVSEAQVADWIRQARSLVY